MRAKNRQSHYQGGDDQDPRVNKEDSTPWLLDVTAKDGTTNGRSAGETSMFETVGLVMSTAATYQTPAASASPTGLVGASS